MRFAISGCGIPPPAPWMCRAEGEQEEEEEEEEEEEPPKVKKNKTKKHPPFTGSVLKAFLKK